MNDRPFIPVWLDDFQLSQGAFRVACNLWRRLNRETGQCNPSIEKIGTTCRMNRRQVLRALNELKSRHIVTRCKQGYGKTNAYTLRPPSTGVDSAPTDTSQSVSNQHHQSVSNQHLLIGAESAPQRYSRKVNNRREEEPPLQSLKSQKPTLDEWLAYATSIDWPHPDAENAFFYYEANGWVQASGQPISNWKAAAEYCMRKNRVSGTTLQALQPPRLPDNLQSQTAEPQVRVAEPIHT